MDNKTDLTEQLTIITWNACTLTGKTDDLADTLTRQVIDIALIQETRLQPQTNFKISNYKIYKKDRQNNQGGGTAILIKRSIKHHEINTTPQNQIETTAIQVKTKHGPINIISTYNPPQKKLDTNGLDFYFKQNTPTILTGDLNSKQTTWGCRRSNKNGKLLHEYVTKNLITIHAPQEPTHYHYETPDILDIALTKNLQHQIQISVLNELDSDHAPVIIQLGIKNHINTNNTGRKIIKWTHFNASLIQNKLTLEPLKPENNHKENIKILERNTITLQEHIQHAIQKAEITIPYETPNHLSLPYIIREQIKYRNRLKRQARLTGDPRINTEANRCTKETNKRTQEQMLDRKTKCN